MSPPHPRGSIGAGDELDDARMDSLRPLRPRRFHRIRRRSPRSHVIRCLCNRDYNDDLFSGLFVDLDLRIGSIATVELARDDFERISNS